METHSKLRAFQIYANLDPRDVWKCAQFVNGVAFLRSAFSGCITSPPYPRRQLTLEHGFSSLTLSLFTHCFALLVLINGDPRWATRAIRQFLAVNLRGALPWFPRLHHCHRQIFSGLSLSPP